MAGELDPSGNLLWERTYGGSLSDQGMSVQLTNDGGYILGCHSESSDGDVAFNNGNDDWWVLKLDSAGGIVWQQVLGSSAAEWMVGVMQTSAGDYVVHGLTQGNDVDVVGNHGNMDGWVARLETSGALVWQRPLGGSAMDWAWSIAETSDQGFIVGCQSESNDGDVSQSIGGGDAWVVKLDASGVLLWDKSLGGTTYDGIASIQVVPNGGFVFVGYTYSINGDVVGNHGGGDAWVVKLNSFGTLEWQKPMGGSLLDQGVSIHPTADGGFLVGVRAESSDGDVSTAMGGEDFWAVKLNAAGVGVDERQMNRFMLFPNPATEDLSVRCTETTNAELIIIDAAGRNVLATTVRGRECSVDLRGLSAGVYSVTLLSGSDVMRAQLVIQ
ncbi:MAG: T9SS type A sorting domain-containing protein [Flavobacteriales bacterium]|nr:T9SS type A sorting domain-containing protein [Flavobacteriales bacterium]